MKSCAIIVSHYESLNFLTACIDQIRKHVNDEVKQHIYIVDQSSEETYSRVHDWYYCSADITIVHTKPNYSGYGIDFLLRNYDLDEDYICQVHVDAFPISNKWLTMPIELIETANLHFVGQLQFISKPTDKIYPPDATIFAMAQCYNVAKRETYVEMSMNAGFTRLHERAKDKNMEFANNDFLRWAKRDYRNRGSDDDVVAFYWEDKYRQHNKLGLAITGYIEPSYARIIEDVVFHFGSCREAMGVMGHMPVGYQQYTQRINQGYSSDLVEEMVERAKKNRPLHLEILSRNYWDGARKLSFPTTENFNIIIEKLKQ